MVRPAHDDLRHVVGEGRAHAGAHLDDLGLGEGRVQRIGHAEQLQRRAHRHGARVVALDHGGADHVQAVAPRHDVDRMARMQQAHRAVQVDLARCARCSRSPRTPRRSASSPRGAEAAAVDDDLVVRPRRPARRVPNATSTPARLRLVEQEAHRRARSPCAPSSRIEQAGGEAAGEIRLEPGDGRRRRRVVALGQAREAVELAAVAGGGDHQRAVRATVPGIGLAPQRRCDSRPRSRTTGAAASVSQ